MPDPLPLRRLAVLIDADNVSNKLIAPMLRAAGELGTVVIRRAYGNHATWSKVAIRTVAKNEAITPVLVIPATEGKDAADLKLTIDAVDLLYREHLDGICIASSDGDFAPLVSHLREGGLWVCGFGEAKTPAAYRAAFDRFIVIGAGASAEAAGRAPGGSTRATTGARRVSSTLAAGEAEGAPGARPRTPAARAPRQPTAEAKPVAAGKPAPPRPERPPALPVPVEEIMDVVGRVAGADGWSHLGTIGQHLNRSRPAKFDPRKYGYRTM